MKVHQLLVSYFHTGLLPYFHHHLLLGYRIVVKAYHFHDLRNQLNFEVFELLFHFTHIKILDLIYQGFERAYRVHEALESHHLSL